jgi:bilirubin oxidase
MARLTRRRFLQYGVAGGAALVYPIKLAAARRTVATRSLLDPTSIPKYHSELVVLPAMPRTQRTSDFDYYEIGVRQFQQQVLPRGFPATTVRGYGSATTSGTFSWPAWTIESAVDRPTRVKWINQLVDRSGDFLPPLFTVDPTLHWANPGGGVSGRDMRPSFTSTPDPYRGPVPHVTHLHGAHVEEFSDGYPEAWFLPVARNIPRGFASVGSFYDQFRAEAEAAEGQRWSAGNSVYQYRNDQRATQLWFHDHVLGMTRLNIQAGQAGMYMLRGGRSDLPGGVLPGPAPSPGDRPGTKYFEIPLMVQDRSFNDDGSLFYPSSREQFDGFPGPYIGSGDSDISPYWNPETFGTAMCVNGRTWPTLRVEARRYRFRILNANDTRLLMLKIVANPLATRPARAALPFWQIGSDGGFLPAPVQLDRLLMFVAERADVIVDFSRVRPGTELFLINEGPDEPFGGGEPGTDFDAANPQTTGQVMKFVVVPASSPDSSVPPDRLDLPRFNGVPATNRVRRLSLNEDDSATLEGIGPRAGLLGTLDAAGNPVEHPWMDDVTEKPALGATETWELYNFTEDAHPIHVHVVQFQVANRQHLATDADGVSVAPVQLVGNPTPPEPWERGTKDTVIAYPGQVTRLRATFDVRGRFVWHCHIVSHEDNEMMRPYTIG